MSASAIITFSYTIIVPLLFADYGKKILLV